MAEFTYWETDRFPRITLVHQVCADAVWASSGRHVLRKGSDGQWSGFCSFPLQWKQDFVSWIRPLARVTRADKCNVFQNSNSHVLGIRSGTAYRMTSGEVARIIDIQGDSVLQGCICEDSDGWTYLGEYFRNQERGPVRIHRFCPDLQHSEVAHEFGDNDIRHVHGVFADPYDADTLWVTSGDLEGECFLFRTSDRFRTIERIGAGTQMWRAVKLHFTESHVNWITDSHLSQNYACRVARDSGELEVGQRISCSAWYGTRTSDGIYLSFTTVEPGPGIQSDHSAVLVSEDAFHWQVAHEYRKDFWRPMSLFKFGVVSCAQGVMDSQQVYLSGEGLESFDGCSIVVGIERQTS